LENLIKNQTSGPDWSELGLRRVEYGPNMTKIWFSRARCNII